MYEEAPGSPDWDETTTFGAFAARALTTLFSLLLRMSDESTLFRTLPSFSAVLVVPAPVTTTSPIGRHTYTTFRTVPTSPPLLRPALLPTARAKCRAVSTRMHRLRRVGVGTRRRRLFRGSLWT